MLTEQKSTQETHFSWMHFQFDCSFAPLCINWIQLPSFRKRGNEQNTTGQYKSLFVNTSRIWGEFFNICLLVSCEGAWELNTVAITLFMPTFCSKTQQRKKGQDFKNSFKPKVLSQIKRKDNNLSVFRQKSRKVIPISFIGDVENGVVCYPDKSLQILLPLSGYRRPRWMNSSKSIIFLVLPNFAWRLEKTLLVVHERKSYCRTVASQCWWWSREKVEEELFEPCFLPISIFLKH